MINDTRAALKTSTGAAFGGAAATSAAIDCSQYAEKTAHVTGTFSATVQVQISAAGGPAPPVIADPSWVNEGAAMTTPSTLHILKRCNWIQFVIAPYTSGTVMATLVGDKSHELGGRKISG